MLSDYSHPRSIGIGRVIDSFDFFVIIAIIKHAVNNFINGRLVDELGAAIDIHEDTLSGEH
jgi:hypothetical protein